jgi:hypothetical protein
LSNTTFQNYDDIIERSCQAWNEILSEDGFIKNSSSPVSLNNRLSVCIVIVFLLPVQLKCF